MDFLNNVAVQEKLHRGGHQAGVLGTQAVAGFHFASIKNPRFGSEALEGKHPMESLSILSEKHVVERKA